MHTRNTGWFQRALIYTYILPVISLKVMELCHTRALVMDTQGASHPNIQHQYYISKVHFTIRNGCLIIQEVGACLNIPVGKEFSLAPIRKCGKDSYREAIQPPDWNLISSGGVEEGFNIEVGGVTQARRPCTERIMTNPGLQREHTATDWVSR